MVLGPPAAGAPGDILGCVIARSPHFSDYVAETALDAAKLMPETEAGLCAFGDRENAVGLSYSAGKLRVWQRVRGKHHVLVEILHNASGVLRLRMRARRGYYFTFETYTERGWVAIRTAPLRAAYLPPWDRGVRVALTAGGGPQAKAEFRYLRIHKCSEKREMKSA